MVTWRVVMVGGELTGSTSITSVSAALDAVPGRSDAPKRPPCSERTKRNSANPNSKSRGVNDSTPLRSSVGSDAKSRALFVDRRSKEKLTSWQSTGPSANKEASTRRPSAPHTRSSRLTPPVTTRRISGEEAPAVWRKCRAGVLQKAWVAPRSPDGTTIERTNAMHVEAPPATAQRGAGARPRASCIVARCRVAIVWSRREAVRSVPESGSCTIPTTAPRPTTFGIDKSYRTAPSVSEEARRSWRDSSLISMYSHETTRPASMRSACWCSNISSSLTLRPRSRMLSPSIIPSISPNWFVTRFHWRSVLCGCAHRSRHVSRPVSGSHTDCPMARKYSPSEENPLTAEAPRSAATDWMDASVAHLPEQKAVACVAETPRW
mmetsp:Transcript_24512/g.55925  ORF Transcript_24512/g.55925 Transcript_24512/m.55925 type:complete len:378 (+) Transcript_24512:640-1773(+)